MEKKDIVAELTDMIHQYGLLHVVTGLELACVELAADMAQESVETKRIQFWNRQGRAFRDMAHKLNDEKYS